MIIFDYILLTTTFYNIRYNKNNINSFLNNNYDF